jgi:hypothetical protein
MSGSRAILSSWEPFGTCCTSSTRPKGRHRVLRRRIVQALVLVAAIDVVGTVLMWMFEDG